VGECEKTVMTEEEKNLAWQEFNGILSQLQNSLNSDEVKVLTEAFSLSLAAHDSQRRNSGESYIFHPLGVVQILVELQVDLVTLEAAILHDVVEDTSVTLEDIIGKFGSEVALLVDGVTKLNRIEYKSKEEQKMESHRKMLLAMAKDLRVVVIKLADRLHNMRTLSYMTEEKQKDIARETLEIFAPLAHRLGMFNIKWELEDLGFRYLEPNHYYDLVEQVRQRREERQANIQEAIDSINEKLSEVLIKTDINGRPKHLYSIWRKMQKDSKQLSEIYDLSAVRVIVESVKDCYGTLGIVHTLWKPIPGRFKDFIAVPKSNMYQSLHTTVISSNGTPLEIQIRTHEMHRIAEYGIAAHWRYKEGQVAGGRSFDEKLSWIRQLLDWHQDMRDTKEFMETLKVDVFADEVFVFTPRGDVVELPADSIPIDFAYRVHTDVGNRCTGARVNGRMVPLTHKLKNGDIVEVITTKGTKPSWDWISLVRSPETKNKIRQWFKKQNRVENIAKGRESLEKEARRLGYDIKEFINSESMTEIAKKNWGTEDDLLAAIGYGGITLNAVVIRLTEQYKKKYKENKPNNTAISQVSDFKPKGKKTKNNHGILINGEAGMMIRIARCCSPVPGDQIVGYITRGRGVTIHKLDCANVRNQNINDEANRQISVSWDGTCDDESYNVGIEVLAVDRPGILNELMSVIIEAKTHISSMNAKVNKAKQVIINFEVAVKNTNQLANLMSKLKKVRDVYSVGRADNGKGGDES
jgi:(p)ppGpp synthetase, RelA/SpoT family